MAHHKEKVEAGIRKLAAEFLERVSAPPSPYGYGRASGPALITVTGSEISQAGTRLKIFLSVYPAGEEKKVLGFANRKRSEFKEFLKEKIQMRSIPYIVFELDLGERARRRFEEVLRQGK